MAVCRRAAVGAAAAALTLLSFILTLQTQRPAVHVRPPLPARLSPPPNSTHPHPQPHPPNTTTSSSSSSSRVVTRPGVVLTRALYAAGHTQPHPEICPRLGESISLLILITSAPEHAKQRQAIRLTWGHYSRRKDIAIAFVLGTPTHQLRAAIEAEDALYADVIMGNSVDSYSNLTLKSLSLLEWCATYCPRAAALLKTDDDMFINVPRLLEFTAQRRNHSRTIWGKVLHKAYPKRTPHAKYYLSPLQFPPRVLPDFATGPAYLMTADCVQRLLHGALDEAYVRLEDVYITGILATKAGIRRVQAAQFVNRRANSAPCTVQRNIALHMVRYHEQFDLWRKLLDGKTKCS